ncbi:hypothetical protein SAMN03080601_02779 [Alkalitalea saponilacus]|uniref:Uncharacterized protein n=1 Tax=Alkalitalea saponilacus TaxID=889453 RepID=A0A1T5HS28_9BACT|nr:hypothetical protein SAMN03080601_02779 [Alkalitalea saponilacus]
MLCLSFIQLLKPNRFKEWMVSFLSLLTTYVVKSLAGLKLIDTTALFIKLFPMGVSLSFFLKQQFRYCLSFQKTYICIINKNDRGANKRLRSYP